MKRRTLATALALAAAGAAPARPQPPSPPAQVFPAEVEQVTVDVVVVDKRGEPVLGLGRNDFTVLDEGQPRDLTSFDVVGPSATAPQAGAAPPRVVTNTVKLGERGRQFVIVFDDLNMSPFSARSAKSAIAQFLEKGTRSGDRVLLVATGGSAWWSERIRSGPAELLTVLKHLDGRRIESTAGDRITDHEAVRITVYRDVHVAGRVQARFERYGDSARRGMQASREQAVVMGMIDPYVDQRASEAYLSLRSRVELTLGVLERCFNALADNTERKSVLLVSDGFADDPSSVALKRATESARRANAAVYFIDTRGLQAMSQFYSAEFGAPYPQQDLMAAIADLSFEGDGSASLADSTGGFSVRQTNNFAAGAVRIGRESSSYYLLGYSPGAIARDGRFRKLEVRVKRKGLTVRARKGYYAPSDEAPGPAPKPPERDAELQRALDAPGALGAIPLRSTAYTLQESGLGSTRVAVVADVDVSGLAFAETDGRSLASLDTLVVIAHRETGEFYRSDQRADLERRADAPAGPNWYSFVREFDLRPGGYQFKLVVRDAATKRIGSVLHQFEVPPTDRLRVSSPILSSSLRPATGSVSVMPSLVVERNFPSGANLYCMFDVYGAAKGPDGQPRVVASHELRRADGTVLGRAEPRAIEPTSIGALVRLIQIPLTGLPPGGYELRLTVRDDISGESREQAESFSILPTATAQAR